MVFTVVSVIASVLLLCFTFHLSYIRLFYLSETSLSYSIATTFSKEIVVVSKRCCSADLLTHVFILSEEGNFSMTTRSLFILIAH